ncbi:serine/threonine protein kinase [Salipaludibacillus keqinensis]|uniref:non-specific serine/threonine protein kinase n=1 Tax=Salipaludibacillus keqinensis TaxID=2045207 RepID=A0A323T4W4_9BACI|nr:serine/threonine-protein kinase [Salipaludibacillus keqinensis]PYZ91561.1 serine/threonine protein kinase [Salipaludibacillus keqinensis]
MRQPTSKNQACNFRPGQMIKGRWHGNQYQIVRLLGEGAIGKVYLANRTGQPVAMKVARESMSVSSEVRALRQISKVRGVSLGPFFVDMDDLEGAHGSTSFYVMEYIDGEPFLSFINKRGKEWMALFLIQLLTDLSALHESGWVFGDLKPENLIVTQKTPSLRWIDVGGMTKMGRSIKEYTEFFDRGYWGLGDRKAEPSYDLFAVAMLIMNVGYPKRFQRINGGKKELLDKLKHQPSLSPYRDVIVKAIEHRYDDASQMKVDLMKVMKKKLTVSTPEKMHVRMKPTHKKRAHKRVSNVRMERKYKGTLETAVFSSFLLFLYILYLLG